MIDRRTLSEQQEKEMVEFIKDHIEAFGCIPMAFECSRGIEFTNSEVWEVAEHHKLTKCLEK